MKTLYLECNMGAAGDMLTGALLELLPDREAFLREMRALGLPGVEIAAEQAVTCGITGTHMKVTVNGEEEESADEPDGHSHEHHPHGEDGHGAHDHDPAEHAHYHDHDHGAAPEHDHDPAHHHHTSAAQIGALIDGLNVSDTVKENAKAVYGLIAEAESRVHGQPVTEIHFHEVGTMDAVADVVGVCLLMEKIGAEKIVASPVHVGSGSVRCAHGVLPVPAPATALILQGVPTYGGQIRGELCTPTGAALLKHFVSAFGDQPVMTVERIGYGLGKKQFERANCVRAFLGETGNGAAQVVKLECNLDDMTGEDLGFAMERLFEAGAYDVYTQPIGMKKSRPGVMLTCVCGPEASDAMAELIMKHTTTLGIRKMEMGRYVLPRRITETETAFGPVRVKRAEGMGTRKAKAEYEDLARIARERNLSLKEVRRMLAEDGIPE